MDKQKKPLKSALKKTTPAAVAAAPAPSTTQKRKHTPTVSTKPTANANNNNKRTKPDPSNNKNKATAGSKPNNKKSMKTKPNNNNNNRKKGGPVTGGAKKVTVAAPVKKVVAKPKKIEVVPEGATLEDFRIVAGTYENILYGVDAYWNEDMTLRLSPIFIFSAHIGCIKSLAIGGHFLASGSTDEKIQLYDLKRRKELGALLQHQGTITALTFHTKTHMLSGSDDGKICVWRTKDWECLKIMKGHQASVHSIAIHPSGKIALSVSVDHSVRLWNLLLGKQASMTRLQGEGLKVVWNPSGTGYSIMFDQEVGIYDMATAKCIRTIKPAKKTRLNTMIYYKDDYLVVGCEDKMIRIYNTATGALVKTLVGHGNRIKDLDLVTVPYTPEETSNKDFVGRPGTKMCDLLTSVSSEGKILVWNMEDVVAPAASAEEMMMKTFIGEHKTDMRVTCVSVQKGIWKNNGVQSFVADGEEEEEEESADEELEGATAAAEDSDEEEEDSE
ncbi:p21-activated protein kinase-interacting protein 1-like protein [Linnemannia schmuckeri]|uniref:P21-activated protein kinase-interacting protein 1-like protein n=1 Tax=Linnemannia schmuckeri TaxID=64567 RepID=A0A9P5S0U6_9FUNG|nr:p21-activated protein kinase-interacting protein 1-like protein [Linnemannia schmuckeri]